MCMLFRIIKANDLLQFMSIPFQNILHSRFNKIEFLAWPTLVYMSKFEKKNSKRLLKAILCHTCQDFSLVDTLVLFM